MSDMPKRIFMKPGDRLRIETTAKDAVDYIQADIVREAVELMESGMEDSAHEKLKEALGDE